MLSGQRRKALPWRATMSDFPPNVTVQYVRLKIPEMKDGEIVWVAREMLLHSETRITSDAVHVEFKLIR